MVVRYIKGLCIAKLLISWFLSILGQMNAFKSRMHSFTVDPDYC